MNIRAARDTVKWKFINVVSCYSLINPGDKYIFMKRNNPNLGWMLGNNDTYRHMSSDTTTIREKIICII